MSLSARPRVRDIVTPVTLVLFVVSTVTGVMLLLHWQGALVKASHEWLSLVFAAIAAWHLARNWKPFLGYLRRRAALVALGVALVVSAVFTGLTAQNGGGLSPGALYHRLADASVATAAPALGVEPSAALARLEGAGLVAQSGETLAEIGARAGLSVSAVLGLVAGGQP